MQSTTYVQEWQALQSSFMRYETLALTTKALTLLIWLYLLSLTHPWCLSLIITALLWLHEGIIRTAQSRISDYMVSIELAAKNATDITPCQLHSHFNTSRSNAVKLIAQYLVACCRPTVAILYSALIVLIIILELI